MKRCGIYIIINKVNGHHYVGSSRNVVKRFKDHVRDLKYNRHSSRHLQNAWNKYGAEQFVFHVFASATLKTMRKIEAIYLLILPCQYNNMRTVDEQISHSHETRAKIGAIHRGKIISSEHKAKISAAHLGRRHSDQHKAKIGSAHRGKILSQETKARIRAARAKQAFSVETRLKMSVAGKGRKQTPEQILKRHLASDCTRKKNKHYRLSFLLLRRGFE